MSGGGYFLNVETSVSGRPWVDRLADPKAALAMAQACELPEIVARVLASRNVAAGDALDYLDPTLKKLMPDPFSLRDMEKAAARIAGAVMSGEVIAVLGDYDVDGATSSALLQRLFGQLGITTIIRIPDRLREGYGPSDEAFAAFKEAGAGLAITVDCGISAHAPLKFAQSLGLDVIVVDHHQAGEHLPDAQAVVNPNRHDDVSGLGALAAVGVTFLLAVAINRSLRDQGWFGPERAEPDLMTLLDLVAFGTVCDVVPLTGLNRALVRQGLKVMGARGNPGLAALMDASGVKRRPDVHTAGFVLGPRINAAGRLGESELGARLLGSDSRADVGAIAERLNRLNKARQEIERELFDAALIEAERAMGEGAGPHAIVVSGTGWHVGVIGLMASRLVERFARPALVVSFDGEGRGTGSARSVPGSDLGRAVARAVEAGHLLRGGGHAMAAGFAVQRDRMGDFRAFLEETLGPAPERHKRPLEIDGALSAGAGTVDLLDLLARAGPFGAGNPEPRFVFPAHRVVHAQPVGTDHIRCTLKSGDGTSLKAIAFRAMGTPLGDLLIDEGHMPLHVAGSLSVDEWGGGRKAQLRIHDAARMPS